MKNRDKSRYKNYDVESYNPYDVPNESEDFGPKPAETCKKICKTVCPTTTSTTTTTPRRTPVTSTTNQGIINTFLVLNNLSKHLKFSEIFKEKLEEI